MIATVFVSVPVPPRFVAMAVTLQEPGAVITIEPALATAVEFSPVDVSTLGGFASPYEADSPGIGLAPLPGDVAENYSGTGSGTGLASAGAVADNAGATTLPTVAPQHPFRRPHRFRRYPHDGPRLRPRSGNPAGTLNATGDSAAFG